MSPASGMDFAPKGAAKPVVKPGEFIFAAVALDHGHIYGMANGLTEAGAQLKWVYDPDEAKVAEFLQKFPQAKAAASLDEILNNKEVQLVAAAAVPNLRGELGLRVQQAGKHYFTDKTPFTALEQLAAARKMQAQTKLKWMVYYSERLHVECAVLAGQLVEDGAIGNVVQVCGFGPHRLNAASRPAWFFNKKEYGGILCDIGSHQLEQFLFFSGAKDAQILQSKTANYCNPQYPELEDFGDVTLVGDNGATGYFRVDWLTPDGLGTWGDGRTFLIGTKGYIELRKYINVGLSNEANTLILVDGSQEKIIHATGKAGYPFFGSFILDCLNGTENAMTQEHCFKAAELCLQAQNKALALHPKF